VKTSHRGLESGSGQLKNWPISPPFERPSPILWQIVWFGAAFYVVLLAYLLTLPLSRARTFWKHFDSGLGVELPERSYGEGCAMTVESFKAVIFDEFVLAHILGWTGKAILLRHSGFCIMYGVLFEMCEVALQHHLPNFIECWWDHIVVDIIVCNGLGIFIGLRVVRMLQMKPYDWVSWKWQESVSPRGVAVIMIGLAFGLICDLNIFYLKYLFWVPPSHPLCTVRLLLIWLLGCAACREYHDFAVDGSALGLGSFAKVFVMIMAAEMAVVGKFAGDIFNKEWPPAVKDCYVVILLGVASWTVTGWADGFFCKEKGVSQKSIVFMSVLYAIVGVPRIRLFMTEQVDLDF